MTATTSAGAELAFYRAFEQGDLEAMMAVWAASDDITCVHPLGDVLAGVAAVRASWAQIFAAQVPCRFEISVAHAFSGDDWALRTVYESIVIPLNRQRFAPLVATNGYRLIAGHWRMVLHHASPLGVDDARPRAAGAAAATRH